MYRRNARGMVLRTERSGVVSYLWQSPLLWSGNSLWFGIFPFFPLGWTLPKKENKSILIPKKNGFSSYYLLLLFTDVGNICTAISTTILIIESPGVDWSLHLQIDLGGILDASSRGFSVGIVMLRVNLISIRTKLLGWTDSKSLSFYKYFPDNP